MLVLVLKKRYLTVCDNWRGISLLDIVGKLFAKIIQKRCLTHSAVSEREDGVLIRSFVRDN